MQPVACTKKFHKNAIFLPFFIRDFLKLFFTKTEKELLDGFYNIYEWDRPNKEC